MLENWYIQCIVCVMNSSTPPPPQSYNSDSYHTGACSDTQDLIKKKINHKFIILIISCNTCIYITIPLSQFF